MMKRRRKSNSKTKESREATESKTRSKTIKEVKSNVIMPAGRGKPKPNKKRTSKRSTKRRASNAQTQKRAAHRKAVATTQRHRAGAQVRGGSNGTDGMQETKSTPRLFVTEQAKAL